MVVAVVGGRTLGAATAVVAIHLAGDVAMGFAGSAPIGEGCALVAVE